MDHAGWLLPSLLALAGTAAPRAQEVGPVVLLGEQADAAAVPELAAAAGAGVLLLVGTEGSPPPIDARAFGGGAQTRLLRLGPGFDLSSADLAALRRAPAVAFGPGRLVDWFAALRPQGKTGATLAAVHEAWRQGAVLLGRGDCAALLSSAFVVADPRELGWEERNPRARERPQAARGLGFQPWCLVDSAQRASGRLERLMRVLSRGDLDFGLYLGARSAVVADLRNGCLGVRGTEAVILIDASRARRDRSGLLGARWSFLSPGAAWSVRPRGIAGGTALQPGPSEPTEQPVEDVFDVPSLLQLVLAPSTEPAQGWRLASGGFRLLLVSDEDSARLQGTAAGAHSLARLRGDLRWE